MATANPGLIARANILVDDSYSASATNIEFFSDLQKWTETTMLTTSGTANSGSTQTFNAVISDVATSFPSESIAQIITDTDDSSSSAATTMMTTTSLTASSSSAPTVFVQSASASTTPSSGASPAGKKGWMVYGLMTMTLLLTSL